MKKISITENYEFENFKELFDFAKDTSHNSVIYRSFQTDTTFQLVYLPLGESYMEYEAEGDWHKDDIIDLSFFNEEDDWNPIEEKFQKEFDIKLFTGHRMVYDQE